MSMKIRCMRAPLFFVGVIVITDCFQTKIFMSVLVMRALFSLVLGCLG